MLLKALPRQFSRCHDAYLLLLRKKQDETDKNKRKESSCFGLLDGADACLSCGDIGDCSFGSCGPDIFYKPKKRFK